ncbi:MAG: hypothetical protein ABSB75_00715 [Candidatus Limnocylindrales bacterium]
MGGALLVLAGLLGMAVALFHIVAAFSPVLQRQFGAPERLLAAGPIVMGAASLLLAAVFAAWGLYGLSGAGWLARLPLLAPCLIGIGAVYALRGVLLAPQLLAAAGRVRGDIPTDRLSLLSSAVSLTIGLLYLAGTAAAWSYVTA